MPGEDSAVTLSLFSEENVEPRTEDLAPGAQILRGFALRDEATHIEALGEVIAKAPFRHMITPGGYRMSVAMTNCGSLGWITDKTGYRYTSIDPESGQEWPRMPASFLALAKMRQRKLASRTLFLTPASSIATRPGRGFRCIKTKTKKISARRSSRSRSEFPQSSSLAD